MKNNNPIIIYQINEKTGVEVKIVDDNVWLSQDQIVSLYQSSKSNISEHIKHIFEDNELDESSTVRNFRIVQKEGSRTITRTIKHYNLDVILAIGYRVKSNVGTQFRQWATETLDEYLKKGFVLNDNLLKEAGVGRYFKELLARIRDIRSSEKVFWRQVLDIFATSVDYNPKSDVAIALFKTIQNKMHWAVSGKTAAELIKERANAEKDFMGLTSFSGNYPIQDDALVAKNYLSNKELDTLNRLVSLYLDFAELQAKEEKVMTMVDWVHELDYFLKMTKKEILNDKGLISHERAIAHAKKEYDKFKKRFINNPTDNEKTYLENLKPLLSLDKKKIK